MNSLHTQMKALLPALFQLIRYSKYKGSTLLVPSPAQKGEEENISQYFTPDRHHPKPSPAQTRNDLKVI